MSGPVTSEALTWLWNARPELLPVVVASVPERRRRFERDVLVRRAGERLAFLSQRQASQRLHERLCVLAGAMPAFIDRNAAPDGPLTLALLWNLREVPSLVTIRRALGSLEGIP